METMARICGLLCLAALAATAQQDPRETGPTTLVIQYRCPPNNRVQLRQFMRDQGLKQLESWKRNSILAGYRVLFSRYVDTNNWDMAAILSFSMYDNVVKWRSVEHGSPAGLPDAALAWTTSVNTYPADLMVANAAETAPQHPVYLVIPYTISVAPPAYLEYFHSYVQPQCDGWIKEGVLGRYELYMQRYPAARPWDSLLILQYNDDDSLGARERVIAKVRQRLQSDPAWKELAGSKQNIRTEKEAVVADELALTH